MTLVEATGQPTDNPGVPPGRTRRGCTAAVLCAVGLAACGGPATPRVPPSVPPVGPPGAVTTRPPSGPPALRLPRTVRVQTAGGVRSLDLDTYVAGVVAGELAVGALPVEVAHRMLALQAIVARTWAAANVGRHARQGFDFCSTTHCQVMRAEEAVLAANRPLVAKSAADTRGQVLTHLGRPIDAVFHADCGGATSRADAVWGSAGHPYLRTVADPTCETDVTSAWSHAATRDEVRAALNTLPQTSVGSRLDGLRIVEVDEGGRAVLMSLEGERSPLVRGEEVRSALARQFGARSIRSTRFTVRREGNRFSFAGRGFGHGVGLCQRGALARLRAGAPVELVLRTYYPGTTLTAALPSSRLP